MEIAKLAIKLLVFYALYKVFLCRLLNKKEGYAGLMNCGQKFMTDAKGCNEANAQYGCKWNDAPHDSPLENCLCMDPTKCSGSGIVKNDLKDEIQKTLNEYNEIKQQLDLQDKKDPALLQKFSEVVAKYEQLRNMAM